MSENHRVVVDINHPGTGADRLGHLVNVALGRQPRPHVEELPDPCLCGQIVNRSPQKSTVLDRYPRRLWSHLAYCQGRSPVGGEMVMAAEPEVIHPRRG